MEIDDIRAQDVRAHDDLPETRRLRETMADVLEAIATTDPDDVCSEAMQAQMHGLCAADGAPLEWQSILGRVQRGTQTWQRVWHEPRLEEGSAGVALVRAALTADTSESVRRLAELQDPLLASVDEINRGRITRN